MKQKFIDYLTQRGMLSQVKYEIEYSTGMTFNEYLERTMPFEYMLCYNYPNTEEWHRLYKGWEDIIYNENFK
jgi:hypothetical protein